MDFEHNTSCQPFEDRSNRKPPAKNNNGKTHRRNQSSVYKSCESGGSTHRIFQNIDETSLSMNISNFMDTTVKHQRVNTIENFLDSDKFKNVGAPSF